MKKILIIILLIQTGIVHSQENLINGNLLETHKLIFSESVGKTLARTDYGNIGLGNIFKFSTDYYYWRTSGHSFGGRISLNSAEISSSDDNRTPNTHFTTLYSLNLGLLYGFRFESAYYPYVSTGFAVTYFDPRDNNRNKLPGNLNKDYSKYSIEIFLETGVRYRFSRDFLLFVEGNLTMNNDDLLDDYNDSGWPDFYGYVNVGISFALTFEKDNDSDGVPDNWDKCEFTPSNVEVDRFGCPVDSDRDGVPDYADKCANTPLQADIDRFGCPLDDDRDGIPNYIDECPNTPHEADVDNRGCPVDTDEDGVPDYIDLCPDTKKGSSVDSTGCYVLNESENFLESVIIYFDSGESQIEDYQHEELDKLAFIMRAYTNISWYIEGHKDNVEKSGEEEISLLRAKSVFEYLVNKGVPIGKLKLVDKGSGFAIADNSTISGRSKNRRVVIFGIK